MPPPGCGLASSGWCSRPGASLRPRPGWLDRARSSSAEISEVLVSSLAGEKGEVYLECTTERVRRAQLGRPRPSARPLPGNFAPVVWSARGFKGRAGRSAAHSASPFAPIGPRCGRAPPFAWHLSGRHGTYRARTYREFATSLVGVNYSCAAATIRTVHPPPPLPRRRGGRGLWKTRSVFQGVWEGAGGRGCGEPAAFHTPADRRPG